jgi:hypothetical protein
METFHGTCYLRFIVLLFIPKILFMNAPITSIKRTAGEIPENIKADNHRIEAMQKALLICGVFASLRYVAVNFIVPLNYPGYNSMSQTISELSAIGAPTRHLWVVLCIPFTLLEIAFGCGVFLSAGRNRSLDTAGALLIAFGIIGAFWPRCINEW